MIEVNRIISCEIHSAEPESVEAAIRETDKKLIDFFLILYEWNETAKKEDAAKIQKDLQSQPS